MASPLSQAFLGGLSILDSGLGDMQPPASLPCTLLLANAGASLLPERFSPWDMPCVQMRLLFHHMSLAGSPGE